MTNNSGGGLVNARDVGGLPVVGGGQTRYGVLYRADAPRAGDRDPELRPWPPTTVVDLRASEELSPEHPLMPHGIELHVLPLISSAAPPNLAAQGTEFTLTTLYTAMLSDSGRLIAAAVDLIATSEGACLVHCSAGKDRTGVVVAIALSAVGVGRADIVADYELSAANAEAVIERIVDSRPVEEQSLVREFYATAPPGLLTTEAAAIESVLDVVEGHEDGAAGWLLAHGLAAEHLALLRARLRSDRGPHR
jgi:protein-tyrosine phosphatase